MNIKPTQKKEQKCCVCNKPGEITPFNFYLCKLHNDESKDSFEATVEYNKDYPEI